MGERKATKVGGKASPRTPGRRFVLRDKRSGRGTPAARRAPGAPALPQADPPARQIEQSLCEILNAVESGRRPEDVMTARTVEIPDAARYGPAEVKAARAKLGASQTVFARMLGVSPELVQHWEQGLREPNGMARRFLDQMNANPGAFLASLLRR